MTKNVIQSVR